MRRSDTIYSHQVPSYWLEVRGFRPADLYIRYILVAVEVSAREILSARDLLLRG